MCVYIIFCAHYTLIYNIIILVLLLTTCYVYLHASMYVIICILSIPYAVYIFLKYIKYIIIIIVVQLRFFEGPHRRLEICV